MIIRIHMLGFEHSFVWENAMVALSSLLTLDSSHYYEEHIRAS